MKTTIEIAINNFGKNEGTLGWMIEQPIKIAIGKSKSGKTCAWLNIGTKSENVACLGYHVTPDGVFPGEGICETEIHRINAYGDLAFDTNFTDPAWRKVEDLIAMAREQFAQAVEDLQAAEEEIASKVEFSVIAK